MKHLLSFWRDFIDLLFPRVCLACAGELVESEELVCTGCWATIPKTQSHVHALPALHAKFVGRVAVKQVFSYLSFEKSSRVQSLLHELKYRNQTELGILLGKFYGTDLRQIGFQDQLDLILSVPLHPKKHKQRGYNQSDLFAEGLSAALSVPWSGVALQRATYTTTQTNKNRAERWQNVTGVFVVPNAANVAGKRVALVDDVMTTGATIESAVVTLLNAGCREVSVITIAAVM